MEEVTAKGDAILEGLAEFGPNLHYVIPLDLQLFLPFLFGIGNHGLYAISVQGVEDITEPLLVQVIPVLLLRQVLQEVGVLPSKGKEVLSREARNIRNSRNLDRLP